MSAVTWYGQIMTVHGPVPPDKLGVCMSHEHLLVDSSGLRPGPDYSAIIDDEDLVAEVETAGPRVVRA